MLRNNTDFSNDLFVEPAYGRAASAAPVKEVEALSDRLSSLLPSLTAEPLPGKAPAPLAFAAAFPEDAVAVIEKRARSVTQAGRAQEKGWRLRFEPRSAPFVDPLMGWTGSADTLQQVELRFPTLEAAKRYAERQGLTYRVNDQAASDRRYTEIKCKQAPRRMLGDTAWRKAA